MSNCQLSLSNKVGFDTKNPLSPKINRLRETVFKNNFSKIGIGKQLT